MDYYPKLSLAIGEHIFSYTLFETLDCVSRTWSQRKAAKELGISHAVLNRRIKESEEKLGFKLVDTSGAGSGLTDDAHKLLQRYRNYMSRLKKREKPVICGGYVSSNLLEDLSLEYGLEAVVYQTDDESAIYLANMDMVDILTLDDPLNAFTRDLDFIPIAYDHLVFVSGADTPINNLKELNDKNFAEITNSSQRLAWKTLDQKNIKYQIVKKFKSPYKALEFVNNNEYTYTFLNNSLFTGSDIIKEDTKHIISLVVFNKDDKKINDFVDFVLGKGQYIIEKHGFGKIK
jgi:molybdenum-dependent DNA-binding transcriptional regulator ModE